MSIQIPPFEPHLRSRFLVKFGGFFEKIPSYAVHSIEMGIPYNHNGILRWSNFTFTMYDIYKNSTSKVVIDAINEINKISPSNPSFPCDIQTLDATGDVDFTYEALLSFVSADLDLYSWDDNAPRKEIKLVCNVESIKTK
jgi:hypothetical protein